MLPIDAALACRTFCLLGSICLNDRSNPGSASIAGDERTEFGVMATMDLNLNSLLCAVDFSKYSKAVIAYAAGLAAGLDAHITVFHTVNFPRDRLTDEAVCAQGTDAAEQIEDARHRLEQLMPQKHATAWSATVRCGEPVEAVVNYVQERDIGVVLAASYGLAGWKRLLMGTIVEELARRLNRPLLVIRPERALFPADQAGFKLRLKNILVGCDLSVASHALFPYAVEFARRFKARLHVVHAAETPVEEDLVDPETGPYTQVQQKLQDQLHERLRTRLPEAIGRSTSIVTAVVQGNPADSLRDYAVAHAADLIIVGSRAHGAIEKLLVGSTTESLIRHTPCEVLTIPCPSQAQESYATRSS